MQRTAKSDKGYKGVSMEGVIATWYAKTTIKDLNRHTHLARRLLKQIPAGGRVLEIAPGPGYFCIELAKLGDYHITGLDISKTFVDIARKNAAEAGVDVNFRLGNASEMPFEDASFDFMVCQAAFKNFSQPVEAIAEMYRVLSPGGTALILDLRKDASMTEIEREVDGMGLRGFNRIFTKMSFQTLLLKRAYTRAEMQAFVAQTPFGTCDIALDGIGFQVTLRK